MRLCSTSLPCNIITYTCLHPGRQVLAGAVLAHWYHTVAASFESSCKRVPAYVLPRVTLRHFSLCTRLTIPADCSAGTTLTVDTFHAPHSWVALPQSYVNSYIETETLPAALRLRSASRSATNVVVSWRGDASTSSSSIQIPTALAQAAALSTGDEVMFEVLRDPPDADIVHITAASADDWSVMEANAEHLTTTMLEQLKFVRKGDKLPIWIRGQSSVTCEILSCTPEDTVAMTSGSIVSVQAPETPDVASDKLEQSAQEMKMSGNEEQDAAQSALDQLTQATGGTVDGSVLEELIKQTPKSTSKRISGPLRLRVQVHCTSCRAMSSFQTNRFEINCTQAEMLGSCSAAATSYVLQKSCLCKAEVSVQEWRDSHFDMPVQLAQRTLHTTFTLGVFVSTAMAEAASVTPGKQFLLQKQPKAEQADGALVHVYAHPDVAEGHVCMSTDMMRQLAVMPHSQVRMNRTQDHDWEGFVLLLTSHVTRHKHVCCGITSSNSRLDVEWHSSMHCRYGCTPTTHRRRSCRV